MAPPTFTDLGKSAKDLFNKGYNFGFLKLDSTSRAGEKNEVEFKIASAHNLGTGKLNGNFDVKYKIPEYGVTLTEKWTTDNSLGTVIDINEQFGRGLKVTLDSLYAPHSGKRSGKLKTDWSLPTARLTSEVNLTTTPVINAGAVFQKESFLIGASATFDTATNKLTNSQLAFGQSTKDYTLHSFVINSNEFGASFFHKVCPNTEIGAQLGWKVGGNGAAFAVATKYSPNRDVTLRAKLNNDSQFAAAIQHTLSPSLKLNLSTQFNLATNDAHKFGLGLEFDHAN